ncbi:MAG: hypothetical protein AMXMBFR53_39600 [Gemmatimonadota bacterium]
MSYGAPTTSAAASVLLVDGTVLEGSLHLHSDARGVGGFETIQHLLDDPDPFFAMTLASGEVALVRKARVVEVRCRGHAAETLPGVTEVMAEFLLVTGDRRAAIALWAAPPARRRTLDLLNLSEGFLRLGDEGGVFYLNTSYIAAAFPVE